MNILIIGFGTAGKYYFNLLKNNKNIKNIFISDLHNKNISPLNYINFEIKDIIKKKIKYAIIATPSNLHYKFAKILIENNINILIEKPFVLKLSHAKELINISKAKKIKCWVTFQNRYNLAIQKLKKIINNKTLGKIFLADCSLLWSRNKKYYSVSWKGKFKSDGGVIANQAIHLLDAVFYIFGKIVKFNSILVYNKKKLDAEDLAIINFVHKNNVISSFKVTTRANQNYSSSIDVLGEKGRAKVSGVSLNIFNLFYKQKTFLDKKNSEIFSSRAGQVGAMGNGHSKILKEFLQKNKFKSSKDLEIHKNLHVIQVLHSIYNNSNTKNLFEILDKQSKLGR